MLSAIGTVVKGFAHKYGSIPLLAEEGAKREPDRAKPQEKPRHQKMGPFRAAPGAKREPDRAKPQLMVSSAKLFRPEDFAELTIITASRYRACLRRFR